MSMRGGELSSWIGKAQKPDTDFERLVHAVGARHPWLPTVLVRRLSRAYGSRIGELLGQAQSLADLGAEVAPGLYEAELNFLRDTEWALTGDDVLWRRSKLGLHYTPAERASVGAWMDQAATRAAESESLVDQTNR